MENTVLVSLATRNTSNGAHASGARRQRGDADQSFAITLRYSVLIQSGLLVPPTVKLFTYKTAKHESKDAFHLLVTIKNIDAISRESS